MTKSSNGNASVTDGREPESEIFGFESSLVRLKNDRALFGQLLEIFVEDYPQLLDNIRDGLERRDAKAVRLAAHSLKGLAANFDARPAVRVALELENAAAENDLDAAQRLLATVQHEISRLRDALLRRRARL
jgi:HPt (histidine-containing phosphotransfer) domain-containing protein